MPMEVGPPEASHITVLVRTIITEQEYGILKNDLLLVLDAQILVYLGKLVVFK